jgi:hypothetical protein
LLQPGKVTVKALVNVGETLPPKEVQKRIYINLHHFEDENRYAFHVMFQSVPHREHGRLMLL